MTLAAFDKVPCYSAYPAACVSVLARRLDLLWILPSALHRVFEDERLHDLARGFTYEKPLVSMAEKDRRSLQEGHMILIRFLSLPRSNGFHARNTCHEGKINVLRGYALNPQRCKDGPTLLDRHHSSEFNWLRLYVMHV